MLFNSIEFFIFFVIVYALYLVLNHKWQNRLLLVSSCIFYAAWSWKFLFVMFTSISVDYICSHLIAQTDDKKRKKTFLIISITFNLAVLGFFKYFNFFLSNIKYVSDSLNLPPIIPSSLNIILPIGISFYTFEAMSYIIDVYKGIIKPAKKYSDYLLFVIYFPHMIAGPIMRAKNLIPQIAAPRTVNLNLFYQGCFLIFWGLFEKIFVAGNLAKIVDPIFANSGTYNGSAILIALYAFGFQLLCDFDGYSNIARGLGLCMGFDIMFNFNLPYFATSPQEFWRRWNISLTSWFRDYLFIPLAKKIKSKIGIYLSILITFFLVGLWHGASYTFIIWGVYHGFLMILYHLLSKINLNLKPSKLFTLVKIIFFLTLTLPATVFFRAKNLSQAETMIYAMFSNFHLNKEFFDQTFKFSIIIFPLLLIQYGQYKTKNLMFIFNLHWLPKTFIYAFLTYLTLKFGIFSKETFIYFQF